MASLFMLAAHYVEDDKAHQIFLALSFMMMILSAIFFVVIRSKKADGMDNAENLKEPLIDAERGEADTGVLVAPSQEEVMIVA